MYLYFCQYIIQGCHNIKYNIKTSHKILKGNLCFAKTLHFKMRKKLLYNNNNVLM